MSCSEISELLHGYLDRELDPVRRLEVEEHLKVCRSCEQIYQEHQALHSAISAEAPYFDAPRSVRKTVWSAVREASKAEAPHPIWAKPWFRIWAPIGFVTLVIVLSLFLVNKPSATDSIARQIVAAQVKAFQADHLTEVASSDQYTVKSWFFTKVGFSAPVVDLAAQDFPLLGGRIDSINNRPVAVVVHHCQKHPINLFVWRSTNVPPEKERCLQSEGYNLVHWSQSGLHCWAVSDLPVAELRRFVRLVQEKGYTDFTPKNLNNRVYKY